MSASDELTANRDYYTTRNSIPFRVAVLDGAPGTAKTTRDYRNVGLPQFVVVDKRGVIRRIMLGWDATNAAALERLLVDLTAQP